MQCHTGSLWPKRFGIGSFLADRFRVLSRQILEENTALSIRRALQTGGLAAISTVAVVGCDSAPTPDAKAPASPAEAAAPPAAAPAPARTYLVFFDFARADLTDIHPITGRALPRAVWWLIKTKE